MRHRFLALGALLIAACTASRPLLEIPQSPLPKKGRAATWDNPPPDAFFGSTSARRVVLHVRAGRTVVELDGWCRVGVWTTLQHIRPKPFVARERWGRLGARAPRRLHQTVDDLTTGVVARVRPEMGGQLRFRVEVAQAYLAEPVQMGEFEGILVLMRRPRRYGYRFHGTLDPEFQRGTFASWEPGVTVSLLEEEAVAPQGPHLHFRGSDVRGFVAVKYGGAETFEEEWTVASPRSLAADGAPQRDFFFSPPRTRAAGLEWTQRSVRTYGADFDYAWTGG